MTNTQKGIICLIKSAVFGVNEPLPQNFDVERAIRIGKRHQILPVLYYGLVGLGVELSAEQKSYLETTTFRLIYADHKQLSAIEKITKAFEENDIDYMLLKGSVLKRLYPKTEMRQMGDADILVKENQLLRARKVMEKLGYEEVKNRNGDYDTVFKRYGEQRIELHWNIVSPYNTDYFSYFGNGWKFARKNENSSHRYDMSIEDMLVYNFVHLANHYRHGGIGIRQAVDIWLILKTYNVDRIYLDECLKQLKLLEFFQNIEDMLRCWFEGKEETEKVEFLTDRFFKSGSFGTYEEHMVSGELKRLKWSKKIKNRWLLKVFTPYDMLCKPYPILRKHKILLPGVWAWRVLKVLFKQRYKLKLEAEKIRNIDTNEIERYQKELNYVGLDFNFAKENME